MNKLLNKHFQYILVSIFLACFSPSIGHTQVPMPEIDKAMPDYTFDNVTHYKKRSASISDFRGKWLFLDFWSNGCSGCISTFPKASDLQREFRDQTTWLLVGLNSVQFQPETRAIERYYENMASRHRFDLISTYDSVLFKDWDIPFVSYLFVIDPQGVLRYVTVPSSLNPERVHQLVEGEAVDLYNVKTEQHRPVPADFLHNGKALYASIIAEWSGERVYSKSIYDFVSQPKTESGFQMAKTSLSRLYNTAYFGQENFTFTLDSLYGHIYSYPIFELRDSSRFNSDFWLGTGLYNYYLRLPAEMVTEESVMTQMREDLKRVFGYCISIENRNLPVWKLIAKPTSEKRIKSKGGVPYNSAETRLHATGFWTRNVSFNKFYWTLTSYLSIAGRDVYIDATGISSNVDISVDADLTDFEDVQRALRKYGMQFIKGEAPMKVLVIRD